MGYGNDRHMSNTSVSAEVSTWILDCDGSDVGYFGAVEKVAKAP